MDGWTGQFLRVDLTNRTHRVESFSEEFAHTWIGGRGFAAKILYDELAPGIDPLGPENKLVVAVGPISGIPAPNTGKTIVAAKSPATGGYGDGNLGTRVTDQLRKAGYDALIVEGRADRPTMLVIDDDRVEFLPADEVWGKGTIETNDWIYARYSKGAGVLNIGPGGENMVNFAVVRSLEGRSGGRPGMGAVMGSKLLKAIVVKGSRPIPQAFPARMTEHGRADLRPVHAMDTEAAWSLQGTTGV
ncbi:MAG: aldehyde ferredoxin oxidoreductase N-terminal domain-containing protein, partial [Chloroflexota bacterium]